MSSVLAFNLFLICSVPQEARQLNVCLRSVVRRFSARFVGAREYLKRYLTIRKSELLFPETVRKSPFVAVRPKLYRAT